MKDKQLYNMYQWKTTEIAIGRFWYKLITYPLIDYYGFNYSINSLFFFNLKIKYDYFQKKKYLDHIF